MSDNSVRKPTIAVIGTEGSGKTVFITALAKYLSTIGSRGVFLNPQGVKTLKYVESVWQTLQQGDWPPSTPPGQLFELQWNLEVNGELESEVHLIDVAGQDLRLLFGDEEERISKKGSLPESMRKLADYCSEADIVMFLINLKDFEGEGNLKQRTENEAAIKGAMDYLSGKGRCKSFCLIITQVDLYQQLAAGRGSWDSLIQKAVPYVYGAYLKSKKTSTFLVSAVNKTRVTVDNTGNPLRMPEPGFGSDGFEHVVDWLIKEVKVIQKELDALAKRESQMRAIAAAQAQPKPVATPPKETSDWSLLYTFLFLGGGFLFFYATWLQESPTEPKPVLSELGYKDQPGFFDDSVVAHGIITNKGKSGYITITSSVTENGTVVDRRSVKVLLVNGGRERFEIELPGIYSVRNPHVVKTEATGN